MIVVSGQYYVAAVHGYFFTRSIKGNTTTGITIDWLLLFAMLFYSTDRPIGSNILAAAGIPGYGTPRYRPPHPKVRILGIVYMPIIVLHTTLIYMETMFIIVGIRTPHIRHAQLVVGIVLVRA